MIKNALLGTALVAAAVSSQATTTLLSEGFEDIGAALASGWVASNLSAPVGPFGWEQGFAFAAQAGSVNSFAVTTYMAANTETGGVVDNWLMTPTLNFDVQNTLSFWTRTNVSPSEFIDRLEVRLSSNGASTDAADFSTLLLSINPELSSTAYPSSWTQFSIDFAAVIGSSGRLAFRYTLPDNLGFGDIVGIDSVNVSAVPEPASFAMLLLGLGATALQIRRRRA